MLIRKIVNTTMSLQIIYSQRPSKKYRLYRKNDGRAKALYLIDSNNEIVEEFSSTVEASSMLFIDRRHIARRCNNRCVNKGLMYMWADEYEELNA